MTRRLRRRHAYSTRRNEREYIRSRSSSSLDILRFKFERTRGEKRSLRDPLYPQIILLAYMYLVRFFFPSLLSLLSLLPFVFFGFFSSMHFRIHRGEIFRLRRSIRRPHRLYFFTRPRGEVSFLTVIAPCFIAHSPSTFPSDIDVQLSPPCNIYTVILQLSLHTAPPSARENLREQDTYIRPSCDCNYITLAERTESDRYMRERCN